MFYNNVTSFLKKYVNLPKMLQIFRKCFKTSIALKTVSKYSKLCQNIQKCYKHFKNVANYRKILQIIQKCFKSPETVANSQNKNFSKILQIFQKCYKSLKNVANDLKNVTVILKNYANFPKVLQVD